MCALENGYEFGLPLVSVAPVSHTGFSLGYFVAGVKVGRNAPFAEPEGQAHH